MSRLLLAALLCVASPLWASTFKGGNTLSAGTGASLVTTVGPRLTYDQTVALDNPFGYYKLDEDGVTTTWAVDSSGNGNGMNFKGGVSFQTTACHVGSTNSVTFDGAAGTGLIIRPAVIAADTPVTIEMWIRPTSVTAAVRGWLWTQQNSGVGLIYDSVAAGAGAVYTYVDAEHDMGATIAINTVYHMVVTINGAAGILYVNGVAKNTYTHGGNWDIYDGTNDVIIGDSYEPIALETGLAGRCDSVAIYKSVLSADRVLAHYNAGL